MSSLALREAVRAAWPELTPDIPLVDTINYAFPPVSPDPLPDVWGTLVFETTRRQDVTMGKHPWVEESGTCTLLILARSGKGDSAGVSAADAVMHAWDGWHDSTGDLWFQSVGAPRQMELEANGEWFLVGIACDYRAQERSNP